MFNICFAMLTRDVSHFKERVFDCDTIIYKTKYLVICFLEWFFPLATLALALRLSDECKLHVVF